MESRAGFHSDGEVVHTLTLGYEPPRPFVRVGGPMCHEQNSCDGGGKKDSDLRYNKRVILLVALIQVCSALVHPFSSHTVPADSELCVTMFNNQVEQIDRSPINNGIDDSQTQ